MLKLLIVSRKERSRSFSTLFDGISKQFDTTVIKLSKDDIKNFFETVKSLNCQNYDRVMFDIPLRRIGKNYKILKNISGLILYEEDAYQEFVKRSEYYRKYTRIYREIAEATGCRLILTGYNIGQRIRETGLDVNVIPKAFDENHLKNLGKDRAIQLGFVGRIKNKIYKERQMFLQILQENRGLSLSKTDPGEEYLHALNDINIFVSADIGLLEYMAKNFEAMGCGCVVLAKRQGGEEESKLGLIHMENIVLYDNYDDAARSIDKLLNDSALLEKIRKNSIALVNENHTLSHRIDEFVNAIAQPIEKAPPKESGFFRGLFKKWI